MYIYIYIYIYMCEWGVTLHPSGPRADASSRNPPSWLAGCLPGCLAAWLPVCLAACLADWLLGCLAAWPTLISEGQNSRARRKSPGFLDAGLLGV